MRGWVLYTAKGKSQILIESLDQSLPGVAVGSHSLRGSYRENKREIFRLFDGVYRFLHIEMSSSRRIKAITLRWYPSDRVLGRIDI